MDKEKSTIKPDTEAETKAYIESVSENPSQIIKDINEILGRMSKFNVQQACQFWKDIIELAEKEFPSEKSRELIIYAQRRTKENFETCVETLEAHVSKHLRAMEHYNLNVLEAYSIIVQKASEWYVPTITTDDTESDIIQYLRKLIEEEKEKDKHSTSQNLIKNISDQKLQHMPIPYSKIAIAMAKMSSKGKKPDTISGTLTLESKGKKVQIENFAEIAGAFGVNTHKLLCAGLIAFAENNNIGDISETINCNVVIPLKEYATMCGYDIEEHPTDDPIKEKNRIKNLLKHIRKQISSDLDMLYNSSLTWNESTKKANRDYLNIRLISASAIRNGYIYMTFGQDFARYLKLRRLTQYPITLFSIDARSVNAYRIGQALSFHYNNDNNLKSGIANRIKIRTLLDYTDLPTIGEIRQLRTSWEQKIKEPFEKALDELYQKGVLSDWWYCKSKDIPLTDEEIQDYFVDFEKWFEMLIHFEINDAVNHTQRLSKKETSQPEKKK